jgi:hypothetical protein
VKGDELRDFALGAAERLPRLFPVLRPRGEQALSFAMEAADELGEDDEHVPLDMVDRRLALLDRDEARQAGVERVDEDDDAARYAGAILLLGAAAALPRIQAALSLN